MTPKWRSKAAGVALVALAFCYVAVVTLHSYKQYFPNDDTLTDTTNALALLHSGTIPLHGGVSGYYAFNPPGNSWGLIPGLLIFPKEQGLAERLSALLFLAATLTGLYLLLAARVGTTVAVMACLIFVLSTRGFYFADSLSPRAYPVFLIWLVYFVDRWAAEKSPSALAYAVVVALVADYWMLEAVTAIVIIPLVWIAFRPPVNWRYLALAAGVGILIWMPYLIFEGPRNFSDLRALFRRTSTITDYDLAFRSVLSNQDLKTVEGYRPHKITGGMQTASPSEGGESKPGYRWLFAYTSTVKPEWVYQAVDDTEHDGVRGRWTFAKSLGGWAFVPSPEVPAHADRVPGWLRLSETYGNWWWQACLERNSPEPRECSCFY